MGRCIVFDPARMAIRDLGAPLTLENSAVNILKYLIEYLSDAKR
jgi:hypothetical protein